MAGSSSGSVTRWMALIQAGEPAAVQKLWGYFQRLAGLARKKFQGIPGRAADEEDVALSTVDGFYHAAAPAKLSCILRTVERNFGASAASRGRRFRCERSHSAGS